MLAHPGPLALRLSPRFSPSAPFCKQLLPNSCLSGDLSLQSDTDVSSLYLPILPPTVTLGLQPDLGLLCLASMPLFHALRSALWQTEKELQIIFSGMSGNPQAQSLSLSLGALIFSGGLQRARAQIAAEARLWGPERPLRKHSAYVRAASLQSCPTLCDSMDCSPPGSSVHGDFPGKNTGVGCHALFQGILPTQGLNPHLLRLLHW